MEVLSPHFSCQYRTSQSDSVNIKNAYFSPIHYLQAKTTSGTSSCHTEKRDRLKLEKATHQLPELYMFLLLSKFPTRTFQNSSTGRNKPSHSDSQHNVKAFPFQKHLKKIIRKITGTKLIWKFRVRIDQCSLNKTKVTYQWPRKGN